MRARAAEGKSERESIMDEAPDDAHSKSLRDGAMPCCVLTLLLVVAAGLGAAAVWLSLAAFDPEHAPTSSLALLVKPSPSVAHNATTTATRGSGNKSSSGGGGGGGGGPGGFRFEAASTDDETWQVTAVRDAQGQPLTWAAAITELREGRLGPSLNAQLAASPHARHSVSKGARALVRVRAYRSEWQAPALATRGHSVSIGHAPLPTYCFLLLTTYHLLLWTTGGVLLGDSAHQPRHRRRHALHLRHQSRPHPGTGRA